jgi:hypothetical protein
MTDTITWKADLHNHLEDNKTRDFDKAVDFFHKKMGDYFIVGIADSDDFRYERFVEQKGKYERVYLGGNWEGKGHRAVYVPEKKLILVKCQESFTRGGHVLAIAMPYKQMKVIKNTEDAINYSKDLGGILDAVHSYAREGIGKFLEEHPNLMEKFSIWEGYNASVELSLPFILPKGANQKSIDFYFENLSKRTDLSIGLSAGTDGHSMGVVGRSYTQIKLELPNPSSHSNFINNFHSSLREVKSLDMLHTESNKREAAVHAVIHAVKMAVKTLQGKRKI